VTTSKIANHQDTARAARWDALRVLWAESSLPRVRNCRLAASDAEAGVVIRVNAESAGLGGVQTCGSTWACPCCSAKIAAHRAGEVAAVLGGHREAGGHAVMLTLTAQHSRSHRLAATWDAVSHAWHKATSGRGWKDDKDAYGIAGYVRVVEVTYGANGWHVHVHALLLTDYRLDDDQLEALEASVWSRWDSGLRSRAYTSSRKVGADVRRITGTHDQASEYFTKATYEVTGANLKLARHGNVTPFGLLESLVTTGDADDLEAWHEWERASKGRRQLTWSRGLRAKYLTAPDLDDDAVAALVQNGETVAELSAGTYTCLARAGVVPLLLSLAAESPALLWAWLDAHGIYYEVPDLGRIRVPC